MPSIADFERLIRQIDTRIKALEQLVGETHMWSTGPAFLQESPAAGAPTDAQYLTLALDGSLSAERVLVAGTGIALTDGGANGNATLNVEIGTEVLPAPRARAFGWLAPGNDTAGGAQAVRLLGLEHFVASGSISVTAPTNTSGRTSQRRWRLLSTANANVYVEGNSRNADADNMHYWRGDAADLGGFLYEFLGVWFPAINSDSRAFFGLSLTTTLATNAWSTLLDAFGFGFNDTDTNWQVIHNDNSGSPTQVDLGANFPKDDGVYDFGFSCDPNASSIEWWIRRLDTGDTASGSISADLPNASSFMSMLYHLRTSPAAGTASAVSVAQRNHYAEWGTGY